MLDATPAETSVAVTNDVDCQSFAFIEEHNMKKSKLWGGLLLAIVFSVGTVMSVAVQAEEYKPKAKVRGFVDAPLDNAAGRTVVIKEFTLPPGFVGGKHLHPGPVFVYVVSGALTIVTDAKTFTISEGELYQEVPHVAMKATNVSTTKATKIVAFQVGETGKPMMIKVN